MPLFDLKLNIVNNHIGSLPSSSTPYITLFLVNKHMPYWITYPSQHLISTPHISRSSLAWVMSTENIRKAEGLHPSPPFVANNCRDHLHPNSSTLSTHAPPLPWCPGQLLGVALSTISTLGSPSTMSHHFAALVSWYSLFTAMHGHSLEAVFSLSSFDGTPDEFWVTFSS